MRMGTTTRYQPAMGLSQSAAKSARMALALAAADRRDEDLYLKYEVLDAAITEYEAEPSPEAVAIKELRSQGTYFDGHPRGFVAAIKAYRTASGSSLKDAKDAVDALIARGAHL